MMGVLDSGEECGHKRGPCSDNIRGDGKGVLLRQRGGWKCFLNVRDVQRSLASERGEENGLLLVTLLWVEFILRIKIIRNRFFL